MIQKIGILTSGGDSPGMNAAIRSATRTALSMGVDVVGIKDGYKGLLKEDFISLSKNEVSDVLDRGGTFLGSARMPEFKEEAVQEKAVEILKRNKIDALIIIGGDGSYKGAMALTAKGINCVGVPGTIDNDAPATDRTIGFDTALNTVTEAVDKLRDTSSSHHRCSVIEVMGNRCGDLALYSAISCGAEVLITPETGYDEEEILNRLKYLEEVRKKRHAIVIVSEKITNIEDLAKKISVNTGFSGRATILGHVQRGGSPTPRDRVLASRLAEKAVDLLVEGNGGVCVGIVDNKIVFTPIEEALNKPKRDKKNLYRLFERLV